MTDWNRQFVPAAVLAMAITVAGCGGSIESPASAATATAAGAVPSHASGAPETTSPPTGSSGPSASIPPPSAPGIVLAQDWASAALVDVATGETFRMADYAGRVIIMETMAIWCSKCRAQQVDVKAALQELPEDVVYVVLDVDPNEDAASLAAYREQNGFEGRYAIAETVVARALAAEFGDQILNPPSTPIVFIGTDGRVTLTEFGHKSTSELVEMARVHGA